MRVPLPLPCPKAASWLRSVRRAAASAAASSAVPAHRERKRGHARGVRRRRWTRAVPQTRRARQAGCRIPSPAWGTLYAASARRSRSRRTVPMMSAAPQRPLPSGEGACFPNAPRTRRLRQREAEAGAKADPTAVSHRLSAAAERARRRQQSLAHSVPSIAPHRGPRRRASASASPEAPPRRQKAGCRRARVRVRVNLFAVPARVGPIDELPSGLHARSCRPREKRRR